MSTWSSNRARDAGATRRSLRAPVSALAAAVALVLVTACGDGDGPTSPAQGTPVGPAGGTVMSADGNVILEIPAGALDAPTDITITPVADALLVTDPLYVRGTGYEVKPAGLQLRERARLRIRFDSARVPTGVRHEQLRIRERDRDQDQWRDCEHVRLQERMVEAWTERFGLFAIVVDPNAGTRIGPLGGTVVSADGNVELEIPTGALDVETEIFITKADDALFTADPLYVAGTAYEVTPAQLQLKQRARLRIRFDSARVPAGVNHDRLRIRERDRDQDRWRDCDYIRLQLHVVESFVERLALYAIVANGQSQAAVANVSLSPGTFVFEEGDVVQMTADVRDADGTSPM